MALALDVGLLGGLGGEKERGEGRRRVEGRRGESALIER